MSLNAETRSRCIKAYEEARRLWTARKTAEAKALLQDFWKASGMRTLRQEVLMAYILRSEKRYVSEIESLHHTLEKFAETNDRDVLATAWSLLGEALRNLGEGELSVQAFLQSANIDPDVKGRLVECSNAIFAANAVENMTAGKMQALYAEYQRLLEGLPVVSFPLPDWEHKCLRVGYLSADMCDHPVAQFIRPLLMEYSQGDFDVYVYSLGRKKDEVTEELRSGGAFWRDVKEREWEQIARLVRADEIDILVDLSGHTAGNALPVFHWRPAVVQISGIGYFNSTGMKETTGFLSDVYCAEEASSPYFTEPLLRLPHSHFCYRPFGEFPAIVPPPCRERGYVTFGCFNNFSKVNNKILALWKQILQEVPDARLLLKHSLLGTEEGREYTKKRMERLGMPLERIEMRGFSENYLHEYGDVDIALDTSPYPGGLTTCEALFMGVPVVTLAGDRHGARFGCSFLGNLDLEELAARDEASYVSIASQLAGDMELLGSLRQELRGRMLRSPLMDSKLYVRDVEELYRKLHREARGLQSYE